MQPESLIKLVGTAGVSAVENQWMHLVESEFTTPAQLATYDVVLVELCKAGRQSVAETLGWAAIEMLVPKAGALGALAVARPFLQALGDQSPMRAEVAKLYKEAYGEREGIEALLAEAGIEKGRPVRRAIRTLEVALKVQEGDYLASRDDDSAARVTRADFADWVFDVTHVGGEETFGAVELADRFMPTAPNAFRVLRQFMPDLLAKRLVSDPGSVVIDLCREHGNVIGGEKLESILSPVLPGDGDWKKWFAKARAALKKVPNVSLEGRPPYVVKYIDAPASLEEGFQREFDGARDPLSRSEVVDAYLRDCRGREQSPSIETFQRCYEILCDQAREVKPATADAAGVGWLVARRVGQLAGVQGAEAGAVKWMTTAPDPGAFLLRLPSEALFALASESLAAARPAEWQEVLLAILPSLPLCSCDAAANQLAKAGRGQADFDPIVQAVLASPLNHFDALLWLWDGPTASEAVAVPALVTLLTKIVRTLEECRRNERIPKDRLKSMSAGAKAVLSARRFDRFRKCLETIEPGMASALKTQLRRLELLSRATRDDLLNLIRDRFPALDAPAAAAPPWMRENVLYVTEAGLSRRKSEIDHHVNVKMKENAKAIGEAAAHGDLSENSEYKFALEERDLLRARLAQMNAEIAMATSITAPDVPTDFVGVGTRVVLRRVTDGVTYEITFLGPWEADSAAGIMNYKAPLAQEIMGKRIGHVVEFNHSGAVGTYEIVELHNALAGGDYDRSSPRTPEPSSANFAPAGSKSAPASETVEA